MQGSAVTLQEGMRASADAHERLLTAKAALAAQLDSMAEAQGQHIEEDLLAWKVLLSLIGTLVHVFACTSARPLSPS